jgi:hypothetical protein
VFGSIDRRQLIPDGDERIGHWIDSITATSFRICMRGDFTVVEQYAFPVFFNWIAVPANSNSQDSTQLVSESGTRVLPNTMKRACTYIKFKTKLTSSEGVLVTSNTPSATHDTLDPSGVRVCSQTPEGWHTQENYSGRASGNIVFDWAVIRLQYPAEYIQQPLVPV